MKKKIYLQLISFIVFTCGILISVSAQIENRNLLQVKFNVNFFKGNPPIYYYTPLIYPDISYKRFFKKKQFFFEFESDNLIIGYIEEYNPSVIGKPSYRHQYILESKIGRYLVVTPRLSFLIKGGFAYRFGSEARIVGLRYHPGTNRIFESLLSTYYYNDFGVGASFELLYKYGKRWYVSFEAGWERFLTRKITTKEQLRAGIGIGYAF